MLSAFSQKVSELESKIDKHGKCMADLKERLENQEKEKEDPVKIIPKEVQRILLSFQGELKDQSFVVNTVQSKVHSFKEELNSVRQFIYENLAKQTELDLYMNILYDLRADVDKLVGANGCVNINNVTPNSSSEQEGFTSENGDSYFATDIGAEVYVASTLNPNVEEFKPRFSVPSTDTSISAASIQNGDQSLSEFQQGMGPWNSDNVQETEEANGKETETGDGLMSYSHDGAHNRERKVSLPPCLTEEEYAEMMKEYLSSEASPEEGSHNKQHTLVLEQVLAEKEQALAETNAKLQSICSTQEEVLKKMEWLEHKVRLLKQDKKRRGETIGKLLRCIDDLRNCGKLDFSRATTERAILTSTLSTRGMPHEERIQVAINVTEAEQLHQYCPDDNSPRFGPDGFEIASPVETVHVPSMSEPVLPMYKSTMNGSLPNNVNNQTSLSFAPHEVL